MNDHGWRPITGSALAAFTKAVNPPGGPRSATTQTASVKPLPFYKGTALVRVMDPDERNGDQAIYYLDRGGTFSRLDGSSVPIHDANALEPVDLSEDNILDYLHFFCRFVQGDEGPFQLVRDARELAALRDIDDNDYAELAGLVRPPSLYGRGQDGSFLCEGCVLYGDGLFRAQFAVAPHGTVEMLEHEQIGGFEKNTDTQPTAPRHRNPQR